MSRQTTGNVSSWYNTPGKSTPITDLTDLFRTSTVAVINDLGDNNYVALQFNGDEVPEGGMLKIDHGSAGTPGRYTCAVSAKEGDFTGAVTVGPEAQLARLVRANSGFGGFQAEPGKTYFVNIRLEKDTPGVQKLAIEMHGQKPPGR